MNDGNGLPRNDFARITRHEKGQAICLSFFVVRLGHFKSELFLPPKR